MTVLDILRAKAKAGTLPLLPTDDMKTDEVAKGQWKDALMFVICSSPNHMISGHFQIHLEAQQSSLPGGGRGWNPC